MSRDSRAPPESIELTWRNTTDRTGERDRFAKSEFAKIHKKDRRLLWHGSRTTNYGGILSQGLRIAPPEAPMNGYAFGKVMYYSALFMRATTDVTL